ncbi:MAG: alanine--tRNA ligase [Bacteroidales bacterium]|jgi:alanyl-tRNA synthetase|nr:alanine--tRNA ligase [Bacteroidales bacterium]
MTSNQVRTAFLDFFKQKGHTIVPSAPVVLKNDPTLMFTNAGMNQFKDIFLGNQQPDYQRVANSQKCLRVSGKHNDLEEVGKDTYHHTLFEMLGNWSFGDYFKEEAIAWSWEFLTEVLKIDKSSLYVTVFGGDDKDGTQKDMEAYDIWKKYVPQDHILFGNKKDNFWEMGDTGPCGPCSEIHADIRSQVEKSKIKGAELVNKDHPQVIEIWNLVFIQYNRMANGKLEKLKAKYVDTGMGFERLCMVLQKTQSNYDTDVFTPLIEKIEEITGCKYSMDKQNSISQEQINIAMRVIADHVRTIAFAITDGQLPSNAKAGYVIRRILRRAVRYGYTFLEQKQAFMYKIIPTLVQTMGDAYPELKAQQSLIERVIKEEEESFLRTLETGIKLLDKVIEEAKNAKKTEISGVDAFVLYDTYGFPLDLTELILTENNLTLNHQQFNEQMQQQKERARNAAAVETDDWIIVHEGEPEFVGYDCNEVKTIILRYRKVKQKNQEFYQIVLSKTPFYAEMGGQVGDSGEITSTDNAKTTKIYDTKRENMLIVHLTKQLPENVESTFMAKIDTQRRYSTQRNHSATHLLHEALREVLGTHVEQKGSYVSPENLRFDFSHFQKLSKEEIRKVEQIVNQRIRENIPLDEKRDTPIAEAQAMGAMALFGEKYGDKVRVIKFGSSVELCGGTHVHATGEIGIMRILSETSIAAGIRRIEAITGESVEKMLDNMQDFIATAKEFLHNSPDLTEAIRKTVEENAELKKQVETFANQKITELSQTLITNAEDKAGIKLIRFTTDLSTEQIKTLAFQLRKLQNENLLVAIGAVCEGKPSLTVLLSDNLVETGKNAIQIIRQAAKEIQGGGGGQPFFAQAGGKNPNGIEKALDIIVEMGINAK